MRKIVCPECGGSLMIDASELVLYSQFECDECGAWLEVQEESPLRIGMLDAQDDSYEDDDEDD